MIWCCQETNDLYRVLTDLGRRCPRYDTLNEALQAAPAGGVLALADAYPRLGCAIDRSLLHLAQEKQVRVYLEYPAALSGITLGEPRPTQWERLVVSSGFFAPDLEQGVILAQHGCWFFPVTGGLDQTAQVSLVVARVAGYDRAVYGLPDARYPILFQLPGHDVLVATSKLSQFVRGRYGPRQAWKAIWERLLRWLEPDTDWPDLAWRPTVRVQAEGNALLAEAAEMEGLCRSVRWFREHIVYSIDQKKGAIEGFESIMDHEGRQMQRAWLRSDCIAETGMVLACDWACQSDPTSHRLAGQVLDTVWSADFCQLNADDPAYGLSNWYERGAVFYGDDNARVILPTLIARALLQDRRWDERVLRCLLANLRTTGALGFRRNRIDYDQLVENKHDLALFGREETISYAPHYQAYLWAAYLLAGVLTGYDGFLKRTRHAIQMTMAAYPAWRWTNGITQEMARMLLPLAFLLRLEDTAERRGWLQRIADDLLAQMQPCGAIREQLGPLETGSYAPPQSNEAYGTAEASLIQANGDPACDLLYTTNYAFLGLHEAAAAAKAVGWEAMADRLQAAEDRLADFLCRIQVRSEEHRYLDGAWMRSFDYERWEYWGSSADLGWGAWCVESGWTNTWIAAVLAMRHLGSSLFGTITAVPVGAPFPRLVEEMMGGKHDRIGTYSQS